MLRSPSVRFLFCALLAYGPGRLILNLIQPDGAQQELIWGIFPPD